MLSHVTTTAIHGTSTKGFLPHPTARKSLLRHLEQIKHWIIVSQVSRNRIHHRTEVFRRLIVDDNNESSTRPQNCSSDGPSVTNIVISAMLSLPMQRVVPLLFLELPLVESPPGEEHHHNDQSLVTRSAVNYETLSRARVASMLCFKMIGSIGRLVTVHL